MGNTESQWSKEDETVVRAVFPEYAPIPADDGARNVRELHQAWKAVRAEKIGLTVDDFAKGTLKIRAIMCCERSRRSASIENVSEIYVGGYTESYGRSQHMNLQQFTRELRAEIGDAGVLKLFSQLPANVCNMIADGFHPLSAEEAVQGMIRSKVDPAQYLSAALCADHPRIEQLVGDYANRMQEPGIRFFAKLRQKIDDQQMLALYDTIHGSIKMEMALASDWVRRRKPSQ